MFQQPKKLLLFRNSEVWNLNEFSELALNYGHATESKTLFVADMHNIDINYLL